MSSILQLLGRSFTLYFKNFSLIFKAIVWLLILQVGVLFLPEIKGISKEVEILAASAIFAFIFLVGAWTDQLILHLLYQAEQKTPVDLLESGKRSLQRLPGYVFVLVLWWLLVFLGFVFLVVPGMIFMTWYSFALLIFVAEGAGGWSVFRRSRALAKGFGWRIFTRLLVSLLAVIFIFSVLNKASAVFLGPILAGNDLKIITDVINVVISRLAAPFLSAVVVNMYSEIKRLKG